MEVANVHMPILKWSKVAIDTDKDMNGKSLSNLYNIEINTEPNKGIIIHSSGDYPIVKLEGYDGVETHFTRLRGGTYGKVLELLLEDNNTYQFRNTGIWFIPSGKISIGTYVYRCLNGYFAGDLALGVIKDIGDTLTVSVVYEDDYFEKASYLTEVATDLSYTNPVLEYDFGTLETVTDNGIITGVKFQADVKNSESEATAYIYLYEDGVEKLSLSVAGITYTTVSGEYTMKKTSAKFEVYIRSSLAPNTVYVKNRYLYMRKRYLGIKAGS